MGEYDPRQNHIYSGIQNIKCYTVLVPYRTRVSRYNTGAWWSSLIHQRSQTPAVVACGCLKLPIPLVSQLVETWKHPAAPCTPFVKILNIILWRSTSDATCLVVPHIITRPCTLGSAWNNPVERRAVSQYKLKAHTLSWTWRLHNDEHQRTFKTRRYPDTNL